MTETYATIACGFTRYGGFCSSTTEGQPAASPAPAPSRQGRAGTLFRSLRHRNFQLFFSGQIISLVGTWMQNIAQAWLIYRLTGSSVLLGVLGFVGQIPIFLLSPLAGLVADRWPRQRMVIATQAASMLLAFILAALTLPGAYACGKLSCWRRCWAS